MRAAVSCCLLPLILRASGVVNSSIGFMAIQRGVSTRRSARLAGGKVGASDSVIREARRPHAEIAKTSCDKGLKHAKKSKKTGEGGVSKGSSVAVARSRSKRAKKAPSTATAKKANTRALGRTREERRREEGFGMVIGVDEAGRGPFAGPVVAAACYVPPEVHIAGIQDSKKVTQISDREDLYEELVRTSGVRWATCEVGSDRIDEINILEATKEAMTKCILELCDKIPSGTKPFVLIDGNFTPPGLSHVDAECVIGGDGLEFCIAAASIIAKVTRDRMMIEYAKRWPVFGFEKHKGYGTQGHRDAIRQHGPIQIHRRSFLKKMEAQGKLPQYKE